MSRTAYVVCTRYAYWPPEVFVIFSTEEGALEHVDAALWEMRVEPFPVYATYDECPAEDRRTTDGLTGHARQAVQRLRDTGELATPGAVFPFMGRAFPPEAEQSTPWDEGSCDPVYAICGPDSRTDHAVEVEVETFYESRSAAQRDSDSGYWISSVLRLPVYASYAECPPARRYADPSGPRPWSQCMIAKTTPHRAESRSVPHRR